MSEPTLEPRSAFSDLALNPVRQNIASDAGLRVTDRDGLRLATVVVRAGQDGALRARMRERFGLDLPSGPRRVSAGPISAIGTGPGAWLIVAEPGAGDLAGMLAAQLEGLAAVTDQSAAYAVFRLGGAALTDVLAKGVALDLHPAAFGADAAAVTVVSHIGVVLWRVEDGGLELAVPRSFFGSFWSWLASSAAPVGIAVNGATIAI